MALVDALGNLFDFVLLPGQAHDLKGVAPLIEDVADVNGVVKRTLDVRKAGGLRIAEPAADEALVTDAINEQPWLPDGPIPFDVDWTLDVDARRAVTDPEMVREPQMHSTGEAVDRKKVGQ